MTIQSKMYLTKENNSSSGEMTDQKLEQQATARPLVQELKGGRHAEIGDTNLQLRKNYNYKIKMATIKLSAETSMQT